MSSEYGINPENLMRSVPEVLKTDEAMLGITSISAEMLSCRPGEIEGIRIYTRIDDLPEDLLDILAFDFRVDWWDPDYTLEEKRQIFKDSFGVFRKLGTKAAVESAISAIYSNTQVLEWFEYGGPPYHFKLLIDATYEDVDPGKHQRVLDRLEYYKNLRSSPYAVEYTAHPQGTSMVYVGFGVLCIEGEITVEVMVDGVG